jgi:branched-chain amino acid transport system ATP-binding protein
VTAIVEGQSDRAGEAAVALEVENLEVTYGRVIVAVQGVSLKVPENSIVTLLGTNGAGKSTTVRAISGFLPVDDAEIRKGAIRFRGQPLPGLPPYRIARAGVVLVPERRKIFETLSVWDNLRLARGEDSVGAAWHDKAERLLAFFPILAARRDQLAGYLSGGERQMLAISQGLLCDPKLLLIDELSLGLMPKMVDLCFDALDRLRQGGLTIVLVEQNTTRALEIAQTVCILTSGSVAFSGPAATARADTALFETFLSRAH